MLNIQIRTIPHKEQKYETCGNYGEIDGKSWIEVSELSETNREFLIFIHEAIEQYLCKVRNIEDEDICKFDIQFEDDRKKGFHTPDDEPGDDINAPYRKEHFFATNIERQLAHELGVDWADYDKECINLEY